MENNTLFERAIETATNAHHGSYRKSTEIPYILHVMEAATIVGTMTTDEEVLAAAVLHDTVEDTELTIEDIRNSFGDRVAALVADESENKRENVPAEQTWAIRKKETLNHLENASREAKMIALGDKLSNIRAISRDYDAIGDELWKRFNQHDKAQHGWYYGSIIDVLSELSEYAAWKEYKYLVEKVFEKT